MLKQKKILIVGGYGAVGRVITQQLAEQFPGRIIVAGRRFEKAAALANEVGGKISPMMLDIQALPTNYAFLDEVGIVVMCLDQENTDLVRACLQRGIHYVDISATYELLARIEALAGDMPGSASTVLLSVGLAPGLSNLLVKQAQSEAPGMAYADIFIQLGLGEAHGAAAIGWTVDNLNCAFSVLEDGRRKRVKTFSESRQVAFLGEARGRTAYRFNFSDQHVLPATLGLSGASTWLCFDSALMTGLFALFKRSGLSGMLARPALRDGVIRLMQRFQAGSDVFVIQVVAREASQGRALYACSLRGAGEGRGTGLVAAKAVEALATSEYPAGVFHMEQLFSPMTFIDSLPDHRMQFEERHFQPD